MSTPREQGYRMPFEGSPHAATWMSWPFGAEEWQGELPAARAEYAELVKAIASCEPVHLLLHDRECEADAHRRLGDELFSSLTVHDQALDDCWFRDNGPTFVSAEGGRVLPVCWRFNAWGEKYPFSRDAEAARQQMQSLGLQPRVSPLVVEGGSLETDGAGTLLSTTCCLMHPKRNPDRGLGQLEKELMEELGMEQVYWLDHGLVGDHTDGHIDTLTRFIAPGKVLTAVCSRADENFGCLEENRQKLLGFGLEVWELPIPAKVRHFGGVRLPETYANFYLCNGAVVVPQYGDVQDEPACALLQQAFPDRRVVPLSARAIITSGGAFHCLTQQQPAGTLCSWP